MTGREDDHQRILEAAAARRVVLEERIRALDHAALAAAVAGLPPTLPRPTPITLAQIQEHEARWGVVLPEGLREFLLAVGDGAPGPWGGLIPLGKQRNPSTGALEPLPEEVSARMREPFAGRGPVDVGGDPIEDEEDGDDEHDWITEDPSLDGVLPLAYGGCAMWAWIVVTGPERGRVWETDSCGWSPAATPLCRPVTFLEWYAVWLLTSQPSIASP
jgi:hypothetical protein